MTDQSTRAQAAPGDAALRAMFAARKQVFIDLLKWDLPALDGRFELDQFDNPHARYLILLDPDDLRHRASARLLPTTAPHLLGDLYPHLCPDGAPSGEADWEISRFCLDPAQSAAERLDARNQLVSALADHALHNGIREYVGIAEARWFAKISGFGWSCRALGPALPGSAGPILAFGIRIGGSTDGGNFQQQYNIVGGAKWSGGGFLATYDFFDNSAILARDRSYAVTSNPLSTFYPELRRHSALFSGHQDLAPGLGIKADLIYKRGDMTSVRGLFADRPITTRGIVVHNEFETFGVAPTLEAYLGGGWSTRVSGFYGTDKTYGVTQNFTNGVAPPSIRIFNNRSLSIEAGVEGPLFALPAGDVRLAAGGGWRSNHLNALIAGRAFAPTRENRYAYGELFVPLASPDQKLPFAHRASITAAMRFEDYSDSGSIVVPKLGFVYAPVPELSLATRGSHQSAVCRSRHLQSVADVAGRRDRGGLGPARQCHHRTL